MRLNKLSLSLLIPLLLTLLIPLPGWSSPVSVEGVGTFFNIPSGFTQARDGFSGCLGKAKLNPYYRGGFFYKNLHRDLGANLHFSAAIGISPWMVNTPSPFIKKPWTEHSPGKAFWAHVSEAFEGRSCIPDASFSAWVFQDIEPTIRWELEQRNEQEEWLVGTLQITDVRLFSAPVIPAYVVLYSHLKDKYHIGFWARSTSYSLAESKRLVKMLIQEMKPSSAAH